MAAEGMSAVEGGREIEEAKANGAKQFWYFFCLVHHFISFKISITLFQIYKGCRREGLDS